MRSIKTKGMIFSLAMILIVASAISITGYFRFKEILVNEVNNAVERIATESAAHLSNYINQFVQPLDSLAKDDRMTGMNWESQRQVLQSQINPFYLNIAVVDTSGNAHYLDDTYLDLSDRGYVQEALAGDLNFSEVIVSRKTNEPVIMVATPILQNGDVRGALVARLDVDFLSDYALSRGYGERGKAYIISEEGSIISRPSSDRLEGEYNLYQFAIQNTQYASLAEFVKSADGVTVGHGEYTFDDNEILMGYATVDNTPWKIYIGTYKEEALSSLVSLQRLFSLVTVVTLLISSLVAYIFVSQFSKPIMELERLFSLGAKGNLTIRFTRKSKDEIGRLGASFNHMMDKIKTLTQYDPLTTLLNQYVLEKTVLTLEQSEDKPDFSLIMVAIDKFSNVNETYGYTTGDIILCEVARRILCCLNDNYQIYRYKGDEFVVLANATVTEAELESKAQEILKEIRESYLITGKTIDIRFSIGLFRYQEDTRSEEPLKGVTHAKNYARLQGSNMIQKYDKAIYHKLSHSIELQADIVPGIRDDQFFLVYQPLFYLGNGKIAEIEALIRWNHPDKGLLFPDQFIDIAEQSGSIVDIDYWVIETACRQLKQWREANIPPVQLSINISTKTFETRSFISDLMDFVRRYEIDPTLIQLELTERIIIKNVEESIQRLKLLRNMGFRVAIDDFGIGYSSLSYIVRLPIDCIKIDKSFVQIITTSREAKTIVSTIINLCKELKLNVIAEGIESNQELEYLKAIQCDIGQGYYFSRPIHMEEIEERHLKVS
jgi:diguanylate cyclase (GGDEF)-like protein